MATATEVRPGVRVFPNGVTVADTQAMPWEVWSEKPAPPYGGARFRKVLAYDQEGQSIIALRYSPSGITTFPRKIYHDAREVYFFLSGDYPSWEYEVDALVDMKPGYWMDRPARSVHGHLPEGDLHATTSGFMNWRMPGEDPLVGMRRGRALTFMLSDSGKAKRQSDEDGNNPGPTGRESQTGIVFDHPKLWVVDSRAAEWEEDPYVEGQRYKVLSRNSEGDPTVYLTWTPKLAGAQPDNGQRLYHEYREFAFVFQGELTYREYADEDDLVGEEVTLTEGCYADRPPGTIRSPRLHAGPRGCVLLNWRTVPDTVFANDRDWRGGRGLEDGETGIFTHAVP